MTVDINHQRRLHHYHFAHHFVPTTFYQNPISFMRALNFERQRGYLAEVWQQAAQEQDLTADQVLSIEGLKSVEYRDFESNFLANIITMPPAKFHAEAIMVCMLTQAIFFVTR